MAAPVVALGILGFLALGFGNPERKDAGGRPRVRLACFPNLTHAPALVGVAWIGFDQPKSLGTSETGGQAALPVWIAYMQRALKGVPEQPMEPPDGIVSLRINAESGLRDDNGALSEWFFSEYVPRREESTIAAPGAPNGPPRDVRNQLF